MQETTPYTPAPRRSGGRIAALIAAGVAALLAVGFIAAGALLLWGDSEKDDQGYLSTGKERYAASTYALASDNLDIDLDGAGWIMDRDDLGNVRLEVAAERRQAGLRRNRAHQRRLRLPARHLVHLGDRRRLLAVPCLLPRPRP